MWRCPALDIRNLLAALHWHLHRLLQRYLRALFGGSATIHWNMVADSLMLHLVMCSLVSHEGLGGSSLFLLHHSFLDGDFGISCKLVNIIEDIIIIFMIILIHITIIIIIMW